MPRSARLSPLRARPTPAAAPRRDAGYQIDPLAGVAPDNGTNTVVNVLTGLGMRGADASVYDQFRRPRSLGDLEVEGLLTNALGKRIADLPAYEATREGFTLRATRSPNELVAARVAQYVAERSAELDLLGSLRRARYYSRGYGSALLVLGTEDAVLRDADGRPCGLDLAGPPQPGARVLWLGVYDSRWWRVLAYGRPWSPRFRQPIAYALRHADHPDVEADYRPWGTTRGRGSVPSQFAGEAPVHGMRAWRDSTSDGYSIFDGLARDLARLLAGAKGAEQAISNFAVGAYKIKDLYEKARRDEAGLREHIEAVDSAKSFMNALILDKDREEFEYKIAPLSGVGETVNSLGYLLSAATGIPMTLLFGMSPGGFSGGESEERNWINYVRSVQREIERGARRVIDALVAEFAAAHPDVLPSAEAYEYEIAWRSLVVLTAQEEVDMRAKWALYIENLVKNGIVQPREVRASAFGGDSWTPEVALDKSLDEDQARAQANLGAGEFASALALVQAYYAPGSVIPERAARALLSTADPALLNVADLIILPRTAAEAASKDPSAEELANIAAGVEPAAAAAAEPAAPPPGEDGPAPAEDAPAATWLPAPACAERCGCSAAAVKRLAVEGLVASRPGGPRGARLFCLEHVQEYLEGATRDRTAQESDELAALVDPYPGEHAARQADPSDFARFRRKTIAPGVALIYGRRSGAGAGWEVQSVRLSAERYTAAEAREWLREHDFGASDFEPAEDRAEAEAGRAAAARADALAVADLLLLEDEVEARADADLSEEERKERGRDFRRLVNMTPSEIRAHAETECSRRASIKRETVIARVLRLLETPQGEWTPRDWTDAGKVVGYIARAKEIRASRPSSKDCAKPTNTYALMNWGHNPDK